MNNDMNARGLGGVSTTNAFQVYGTAAKPIIGTPPRNAPPPESMPSAKVKGSTKAQVQGAPTSAKTVPSQEKVPAYKSILGSLASLFKSEPKQLTLITSYIKANLPKGDSRTGLVTETMLSRASSSNKTIIDYFNNSLARAKDFLGVNTDKVKASLTGLSKDITSMDQVTVRLDGQMKSQAELDTLVSTYKANGFTKVDHSRVTIAK